MDSLFYIWLIIGAVLMVAEIVGTDYFLLFLGLSALITSIVAATGFSLQVQIIVFCILSFCSIIFWFYRHSKAGKDEKPDYQPNSGLRTLVGRVSLVDSVGSDSTVKIVVNDTVYLAFVRDESVLKPGESVKIVDFDASSDRLIVEKDNK
jgi:hypothetical protein